MWRLSMQFAKNFLLLAMLMLLCRMAPALTIALGDKGLTSLSQNNWELLKTPAAGELAVSGVVFRRADNSTYPGDNTVAGVTRKGSTISTAFAWGEVSASYKQTGAKLQIAITVNNSTTDVLTGLRLQFIEASFPITPIVTVPDAGMMSNRHISNNWPMHGQLDEVHPEPAGFPAAITRKVGKGQVVHICTDIFTVYRRLGDVQMLRWLREIITDLLPTPYFETDAPSWVDVSLRRKDGGLLIHLVNCNSGRDVMQLRTDDLWVDEIPTIGPITCKVRGEKPKNVTLEPGAQTANWSWENGILTITVPQLSIHRCIKVQK